MLFSAAFITSLFFNRRRGDAEGVKNAEKAGSGIRAPFSYEE